MAELPEVRRAEERDIVYIIKLLKQVNLLHHKGRPDLFKEGTKYSEDELRKLIKDETRPIFVAVDESGEVLGHGFCELQETSGDGMLVGHKTLYIDDICVDEKHRRQNVGNAIYRAIQSFASETGCYNITLNVWEINPTAYKFYESLGMKPMKTMMEFILPSQGEALR